jgi:Flp pilus assembly protein TadD
MPRESLPLLARILVPLLLTILFNISPQPSWIGEALQAARSAAETNHPQQVVSNLEHYLALYPWRGNLWEQVGFNQAISGQWQEAAAAFRKAEKLAQLSPDGQLSLGDALIQSGDTEGARLTWQALLLSSHPPQEVYDRLFKIQVADQLFVPALQTLHAWHTASPKDLKPVYLLGIHLASPAPRAAGKFLSQVSSQKNINASNALVLNQAVKEALSYSDTSYGQVAIGRALGKIGEWDLAIRSFEEAVRINPNYGEAWALLAQAKHSVALDEVAEIRKAQAANPQSTLVQALSAVYWREHGKPELSLALLYPLSWKEPENCIWQGEIGASLELLGNSAAALRHYQQAVENNPQNSLCWQALANYCISNGVQLRNIGLPAARQAAALDPQNPATLLILGQVMASLEDTSEAERFYYQALALDRGYAPAYLELGKLYLIMDNRAAAYHFLTQAYQLSPAKQPVGIAAARLLERYY